MGTATGTRLELCLLLLVEVYALFIGQRQLLGLAIDATGSRLLGYLLAMPGTVVHEGAHYVACVVLRVPVGGQVRQPDGRQARVRWFAPRRDPVTGSITLGSVPYARTDPLRSALIAIAPVVVVPALLMALVFLLAGSTSLEQLRHVLPTLAPWRLVLLLYVTLSCAQAVFPSKGDHIGPWGAVALAVLIGAAVVAILELSGWLELTTVVRDACLLLAVPAIASVLSLVVLFAITAAKRAI
jgi:hypothetical protein